MEMWITLAVLSAAIILFITEWLRVDLVALSVVVSLMLFGILTVDEAIAGFANPIVLTIASLFIVGGAVFRTGLAAMIGRRILRIAGTDQTRLTIVIMLAVALMSGFISDTGVVAVMLPAIVSLAASSKISPSKLLIPMAFGSLLGGAATLIGTPPNIIVAGVLRDAGLEPFGFFSFTPMGLVLIAGGILFMTAVGVRILPDYRTEEEQEAESSEELLERYRVSDELYRLLVTDESLLVGKTTVEAAFGKAFNVSLITIKRKQVQETGITIGEQRISAAATRERQFQPELDTEFHPDDVLIVQGAAEDVARLAARWQLIVQPITPADHDALVDDDIGVVEVLIPSRSSLIGHTIVNTRFGAAYDLTVLRLRRPGTGDLDHFKDTRLQFGDTLLVQGQWENIRELRKRRRDFVLVTDIETNGTTRTKKAPIALLILVGMLVLMVSGLTPVTTAAMAAGLLMVVAGCLTMDEAYRFIDWKSLVLIAGMLPMATALQKVGLVEIAATGFTSTLGNAGPLLVLAGFFLITSVFTQVLSNTATTVLIAPIALAAARQLGVEPYALLMGVAVAASMAFASPVASPVNTLVMGAGNYRFGDYIKVGVPMIVLTMLLSLVVLPLLFPF